MARFLYSLLLYLLLPLILLRLAYRSWRAPDYRRRVAERFGFFAPPAQTGGLWVHAVSVGESIAAAPLIERFLNQYPQLPVVVTTMTPTGSERVRAMFGDRVFHVYAPYDLPGAVARFLKRIRPCALVIMETEIWPNMVCQTRGRGVPVVLANARLSARSARGYGRVSALTGAVFSKLSMVAAQSRDDAERFAALGVAPDALDVTGSIKFDISLSETQRQQATLWRRDLGERPIWIAASTHEGEDDILLSAHTALRKQQPEALLILVPRHPERFDSVAALVRQHELSLARRSRDESAAEAAVLLGDTMGELVTLFGCADLAFIGGSLVERGGHNSLEAAAWGLPIITGPSDFNFAEISRQLQEAGGLRQCSPSALTTELVALMGDDGRRAEMGRVASQVVESNRGALERLCGIVDRQLG